MQTATTHHFRSEGGYRNPVDDQLYDLLQVLTSKCEAIEAYAKYEQDAEGEVRDLFQQLGADDARHAERLLEMLKRRLTQA